jgi:hypothetical protein
VAVPDRTFQPSLMFLAKANLLVNIKLGWRGLSGTNTLAYYEHTQEVFVAKARSLTRKHYLAGKACQG